MRPTTRCILRLRNSQNIQPGSPKSARGRSARCVAAAATMDGQSSAAVIGNSPVEYCGPPRSSYARAATARRSLQALDTEVHAAVLRRTSVRLVRAHRTVRTIADGPQTRIRHVHRPEKACGRLSPQFGDSESLLARSSIVSVAFDEHQIVEILNQPAGEQPAGVRSHD